jgi:rsbT antagonist protein RsbS
MRGLEPSELGETMETFTVVQKLEDLLLVSVPRDLTDTDVLRLRQQVLRDIRRYDSRWVLLDFSLVDICDSFFGRFIHSTAQMAKLMGADVIVAGLQDAVIETMVELGMTLPNIHAVLDLDDALALSREYKTQERTDIVSSADLSGVQEDGSRSGGESSDWGALYGDSTLTDWDEV